GYPMPMTDLFYYPVIAELQGIFAATLKICRYAPGFPAIAAKICYSATDKIGWQSKTMVLKSYIRSYPLLSVAKISFKGS
ncbi:MAG: hypothetical protein ABSG48_03390, partial [Geobacteraceae bacterium]